MFEGLKKKFSSFIGSISKKEQEKEEAEEISKAKEEIRTIESAGKPAEMPQQDEKPAQEMQPAPAAHHAPAISRKEEYQPKAMQKAPDKGPPEHHPAPQHKMPEKPHGDVTKGHLGTQTSAPKPMPETATPPAVTKAEQKPAATASEAKTASRAPKVTLGTRLKGVFSREVTISEKDVEPFLEELKLSLLQSDVNYGAAEKILEEMRKELTRSPIRSGEIEKEISGIIRNSILKTLDKGLSKSIPQAITEARSAGSSPFTILFIGPNGAGKTTTIAKVANLLLKSGISCMISASDTFRAAAIEQTVHHANKLGVEVVKGAYGADPASIAFDAVAHAKASGINVVLIDSAGRQETNKNLMEEMKKMVRVAKPNMKIFIGEAVAGNSLLDQVSQFKEAIGLDGIIITKLDADAKGGNTLSILSETSVPILYFGTGEGYDELMPYDPQFIINNIVPN